MRPVSEIEADIEATMKPAEARWAAASEDMRGLRPAELDWATAEEKAALQALQLELVTHPDNSTAAAKARVAAKREARIRANATSDLRGK